MSVSNRNVSIAPFVLLRVAALPYRWLLDGAVVETKEEIAQRRNAKARMERRRPQLEEALYEAVPQISERKLRAKAIALRRAIHNGREGVRVALPISEFVSPDSEAALDEWLLSSCEAADRLEAAERELARELDERVRPTLHALVESELFLRPLLLAVPQVYDRVAKGELSGPRGKKLRKLERTLMRYAARATAKTSPFSTFMYCGLVDFDEASPNTEIDASRIDRTGNTTLSRGILARIHEMVSAEPGANGGDAYPVNPTIRVVGDSQVAAMVSAYSVRHDRVGRERRLRRFRLHAGLIGLLEARTAVTREELLERLGELGVKGPSATALIRRLVRAGVLRVLSVWDGKTEDAAGRMIEWLERGRLPGGKEVSCEVGRMVALAESARTGSLEQRREALEEISETSNRLLHIDTGDGGKGVRNVVVEDGWLSGLRGQIGKDLVPALQRIGGLLSRKIVPNPVYLALRRSFVERHGVGGTCDEVETFLHSAWASIVPKEAEATDPSEFLTEFSGLDGDLGLDSKNLSMRVTVQLQIAIPNASCIDSQETLIVVNQAHQGIGWLSARHCGVGNANDRGLRERLQKWLRDAYDPVEAVELLHCSECQDHQSHDFLTRRVLAAIDEPFVGDSARRLAIEDLSLRHDAETGLLEFKDSSGQPVTFVYLGGMIPIPQWGLPYLLVSVGEPFAIQRPAPEQLWGSEIAGDVEHQSRVGDGNCVLMRETWWVRSRVLRKEWLAGTGARRMSDFGEALREHGIPDVFFASGHAGSGGGYEITERHRKPICIDSHNPVCLDVLDHVAEQTEWTIIHEALPAPDQTWLSVSGERHVSELQVEMVINAVD